jgi:hypothetical protein
VKPGAARFRFCFAGCCEALADAQNAAVEMLGEIEPPPFVLPEAEITAVAPERLYSSLDDWREATDKLIAYRDLGGDLDPDPRCRDQHGRGRDWR